MLDPVERDEDMDRTYYPLPGGWEVQTKGRGSTFRICDTKTGERCAVIDHSPDTMVHHAIEQIAVEARAEIDRLQVQLRQTRRYLRDALSLDLDESISDAGHTVRDGLWAVACFTDDDLNNGDGTRAAPVAAGPRVNGGKD